MTSFDELLQQFQDQQKAARQANEQRYSQALKIHNQRIRQYKPGGGYGAGALEQLERQKELDVAQQQQGLVSSGLAGTTMAATIGKRWEETTGAKKRLELEDMRQANYADALKSKADLIERRQDIAPDANLIAQLVKSASNRPNEESPTTQRQKPRVSGRVLSPFLASRGLDTTSVFGRRNY